MRTSDSTQAKAALDAQSGLLISHSTTILMLGTDNNAKLASRAGDMHSDSILLLRTDPSHHRLYYLSIPRDLQVPIPGSSTQKINAAFQIGGAALAIRTIRQFTGLKINHVMVVNFGDFRDLIDGLGGITVDVPKPIRSNRFDCPYASQARCDRWPGWRFRKGRQHMNGERALIYSRIRENVLDPSETDVTRGARQQAVMDATAREVHVDRDAHRGAVQRQLARKAADDRPDGEPARPARLGEVPRVELELGPLPSRRRPRRRRRRQPERGQPGDDRHVPRQVGATAADRPVQPGLRHGPPAAIAPHSAGRETCTDPVARPR